MGSTPSSSAALWAAAQVNSLSLAFDLIKELIF
jgi:hypothetical protein